MRRVTWVGLVIVLVACGEVLDDPNMVTPDASVPPTSPTSTPPSTGASCALPSDCLPLATTPPGCAVAECVAGKCVYHALDHDQDGHRSAHCKSNDSVAVEIGDDCDDDNPNLYPGHDVDCSELPDAGVITYPKGAPVGACTYGKRSCGADGTVSACTGAVGPVPVTTCTPAVDEGCTGNPVEKCACTAGENTSCGHPAVGKCHPGTSTCQADNTFGPCVGNAEPAPRNCASAEDFNCNGVPDKDEAECQCPGGNGPGASRPCNEHPGFDGQGVCQAGTQTCTANGSSSSWSGCTGDVGPSGEQCDGLDRNCNGIAGIDEPAPPPPPNTTNCAKLFACPAGGRGPLYFRDGVGWTNYSGLNTTWTGYAVRGVFAAAPAGQYRISRTTNGMNMGPVSVANPCCGNAPCPTGNVLYDGEGQFYTFP